MGKKADDETEYRIQSSEKESLPIPILSNRDRAARTLSGTDRPVLSQPRCRFGIDSHAEQYGTSPKDPAVCLRMFGFEALPSRARRTEWRAPVIAGTTRRPKSSPATGKARERIRCGFRSSADPLIAEGYIAAEDGLVIDL